MTALSEVLEDEVSFYAVYAESDEDFYEHTHPGDGELLGRVTIVNGRPHLTLPAEDT